MASSNSTGINGSLEELIYYLAVVNHDYCFRILKLADLTDNSTPIEKALHEKWTRSNHLCLLFIKKSIGKTIKGSTLESDDAKTYLASVEKRFASVGKSLVGTLMGKLVTMKYNGSSGIAHHICEMANLATQLQKLNQKMNELFLIEMILQSLPDKFEPFKIHRNTNDDDWDVNELQSKLIQEEQRLKQVSNFVAHKRKSGKNFKAAPKKKTVNS
ncbi:uncharacterized protein LOC122655303 [Telopea speciosissima]|uniref:uncharacterized protein LOC122655303 n=1 Tax=Telopea speciosissima TaxID=54955 RepID=UPI001CC7780E|nr:uncharacterized protein LOC122655303 [Telopea speciosissima]